MTTFKHLRRWNSVTEFLHHPPFIRHDRVLRSEYGLKRHPRHNRNRRGGRVDECKIGAVACAMRTSSKQCGVSTCSFLCMRSQVGMPYGT